MCRLPAFRKTIGRGAIYRLGYISLIHCLQRESSPLGPFLLHIWAQQRLYYVSRYRFVSLIPPYTIRCLHASIKNLFFLHGFLDFKTSFWPLICTNPSIHCPLFACKHAEFIFLPCKFQCGSAGSFLLLIYFNFLSILCFPIFVFYF